MDEVLWEQAAEHDGQYAIAVALLAVARAVDHLGNADAATSMGGLEALGKVLKEGCERMAYAVEAAGRGRR